MRLLSNLFTQKILVYLFDILFWTMCLLHMITSQTSAASALREGNIDDERLSPSPGLILDLITHDKERFGLKSWNWGR